MSRCQVNVELPDRGERSDIQFNIDNMLGSLFRRGANFQIEIADQLSLAGIGPGEIVNIFFDSFQKAVINQFEGLLVQVVTDVLGDIIGGSLGGVDII